MGVSMQSARFSSHFILRLPHADPNEDARENLYDRGIHRLTSITGMYVDAKAISSLREAGIRDVTFLGRQKYLLKELLLHRSCFNLHTCSTTHGPRNVYS
eukprot:1241001-Amphidinium_carterae.1